MSLWNKIEQHFKKRYLKYVERIFYKESLSPAEVKLYSVRRILVVRSHDQLGDFLLCTPALRALRNRFPKAKIGVVVRSYFADVARCNTNVNEVLVFYENGLHWTPKRIRCLWKQLHRRWDMAIVLSSESHSLTSDLLAMLSGARYIVGSERFKFPGCTKNFFYNLISPDSPPRSHQSVRNLDIVRYIGADTDDLTEQVSVSASERAAIRNQFVNLDWCESRPIIGLHVGANKISNRWPVERFGELAQILYEKYDALIVLFWGPREEQLSKRFLEYINFNPIRIAPSTLRTLAKYFAACDAVVCNDTGIMHLCAAVGTPLVAVFGPTDPTYWKPIGDKFIAIRGKNNRTENVTVEEVLEDLSRLIPLAPKDKGGCT